MSKYLLEIGTEELPYKFIPSAIEQLKNGFEGFLKNNKRKSLKDLSQKLLTMKTEI